MVISKRRVSEEKRRTPKKKREGFFVVVAWSSFRTHVDICNTNNTSPSSFFFTRTTSRERETKRHTPCTSRSRARRYDAWTLIFFSICVVVIVNFIVIIIVSFCQMPLFFRIVLFASFVSSDIYFSSSRGFNKTLIIIIIVRDVFFFFFFFFFFCYLSMDDTNRFWRPNEATTARPWCIRAAARPTKKASVREDKKSRLWD